MSINGKDINKEVVAIRMTREQALEMWLLACRCGHSPDNHFQHTGTCERCECRCYREVARTGELVRP